MRTDLLNERKDVAHGAFESFLLDGVVTCGQVTDN